jgi:hypothetical protein
MYAKTLLICTATLLLSACDDAYIQNEPPGGPGYGSSSWNVSDRTLVRNCEDMVAYRIHRKLGRDARIRFDRARIYHNSRDRARVEGNAYAGTRKEERRLEYRCTMNRRNGEVLEKHLDWSGHNLIQGKRNRKALEACKERIRERLRREVQGSFRVTFHGPQVEKISKRMRRVTGSALLENRSGEGRIAYSCKVHLEPLEVYSDSWHWTRHLPDAPTANHNYPKARRLCQQAMRLHLQQKGHSNISFVDVRAEKRSGKHRLVKMKVSSRYQGRHRTSHHSCRVNVKNGRILELD